MKFGGKDYIANVAAMMSYSLPGAKFINHGQLEGFANRLDVHLRRSYKENGSAYTKTFYKALLPVIASEALRNGTWQKLSVEGDQRGKFLSWKWAKGSEKYLFVINYTEGSGYCTVKVPDASSGSQTITEMMSGQKYVRNGDEMRNSGLGVIVDGWNG